MDLVAPLTAILGLAVVASTSILHPSVFVGAIVFLCAGLIAVHLQSTNDCDAEPASVPAKLESGTSVRAEVKEARGKHQTSTAQAGKATGDMQAARKSLRQGSVWGGIKRSEATSNDNSKTTESPAPAAEPLGDAANPRKLNARLSAQMDSYAKKRYKSNLTPEQTVDAAILQRKYVQNADRARAVSTRTDQSSTILWTIDDKEAFDAVMKRDKLYQGVGRMRTHALG
jgi:hypothetical protein